MARLIFEGTHSSSPGSSAEHYWFMKQIRLTSEAEGSGFGSREHEEPVWGDTLLGYRTGVKANSCN